MTLPNLDVQFTRENLLRMRESCLSIVDVCERILNITPRTAELRKQAKEEALKSQTVVTFTDETKP